MMNDPENKLSNYIKKRDENNQIKIKKIDFNLLNLNNKEFEHKNYLEDSKNIIINKIKSIKKKKMRSNQILYYNNKQSKSLSKDKIHKFQEKRGAYKSIEFSDKKSLNIPYNISEEKNNKNKDIIKEGNNSFFISSANSKININLGNNKKKNDQKILQNQREIKEYINTYEVKQNKIKKNKKANNINNNTSIFTINNNIYINKGKQKYINNIKITCTNLNIYNYSNQPQNFQNIYIIYQNKQLPHLIKIYKN